MAQPAFLRAGIPLLLWSMMHYDGSNWDVSAGIDYSMKMGDGANAATAYDANGNIKHMWQRGWKLGGSQTIDSLVYQNDPLSNKLSFVRDGVNDPNTLLSDFKEPSANNGNNYNYSTADYSYDVNGNMIVDSNKSIGSITYNHLNVPTNITVTGKGSIAYVYDNVGTKLKKTVTEGSIVKTTLYLNGFVYENDTVQLLLHEEGRIRLTRNLSNAYNGYAYDYFEKDHLGNVRVVLTEQRDTAMYPEASMETGNLARDTLYYSKVLDTRVQASTINGYPADGYTTPNDWIAKTNGSGNRVGPGIVLKVMAGDKINLRVSSWYKLTGTPSPPVVSPLDDLVAALIASIGGSSGKFSAAEMQGGTVVSSNVNQFLSGQTYNSARPKAFVNWVLFNEQLKYDGSSSGFEQVPDTTAFRDGSGTPIVHVLDENGIVVNKSGYIYIYVSNETPNVDVFFDNLQVTHIKGPLLEETHYYPFGLTMAGISSRVSASNYPENKMKFNEGTELNTSCEINLYETSFRSLDPQLGRFWQIDPLADAAYEHSTYAYGNNNPLMFNDPLGLYSDSTGKPGFSKDNPNVLPTVEVTAKRAVPPQFLNHISFRNNRGYSIASNRDWPLSFSRDRSNDLLDSWAMGLGAENRVYLPSHPMTQRLKNAYRIHLAKMYFYKKYLSNFKNGQSLKGASVTNYKGKFGLLGVFLAGTDLVEQFVGSFTVNIHVDDKGQNLLFVVSNTTSNTSGLYRIADSHDRVPGQLTARGNLNQVYIWQEPISSSGFLMLINPAPSTPSSTTGIVGSPFR
jgi:RHS repeat-associated protein